MRPPKYGGEGGSALLFTVALTLLVALALHAVVAVVVHEGRGAAAFRDSAWAFQVAEAGLERAVFELGRDPDWADQRGATALLGSVTRGAPLCLDPSAVAACPHPAEAVPFPSGQPLGDFRVLVTPHAGAWCAGPACLCVQATGRAGGAVRRVEAVLTREAPEARVGVVGWRELVEQSRGPCSP